MNAAPAPNDLAACREAALSFLDRQAYLTPALRQKLGKRGFDSGTVQRVLADLSKAGLLNDAETARSWIERKRTGGVPLGEQRLRAELYRRGLAGGTVAEACATSDPERARQDEQERAFRAATGKLKTLAREPDAQIRKTKLLRFLAGRGFAADVALVAIRRLNAADTE